MDEKQVRHALVFAQVLMKLKQASVDSLAQVTLTQEENEALLFGLRSLTSRPSSS